MIPSRIVFVVSTMRPTTNFLLIKRNAETMFGKRITLMFDNVRSDLYLMNLHLIVMYLDDITI